MFALLRFRTRPLAHGGETWYRRQFYATGNLGTRLSRTFQRSEPRHYQGRRGLIDAELAGNVVQVGKHQHWAAFMYGRERQLLAYVMDSVEEGDSAGVLDAMNKFWSHHFGMKGVDSWSIRTDILDATIAEKKPKRCLELGTYCGYSALRIARSLESSGYLVSVEADPLFAAIATKIIEYAGYGDRVRVIAGTVEDKLQRISRCIGERDPVGDPITTKFDFVLCDHSKARFVPDLELLEQAGLAGPGTVVMGDTTLYPGEDNVQGAKDLLSHFASSDKYRVHQHVGTDRSSGITVCEWQHIV